MKEQVADFLGKKIFFLYPPTVFESEIIEPLSALEYEVYYLSDPDKARIALRKEKNAICFINIDTGLSEEGWKGYISSLRREAATKSVLLGIFSSTPTEADKQHLIDTFQPECGVFSPRTAGHATLNNLVAVLEKNNAKGRRKYVRAYCQNDNFARLNFTYQGSHMLMRIRDISSVGLCCFTTEPVPDIIPKNAFIKDAQLSLRGTLINCNLLVFAEGQQNGLSTYVMLFTKDFDVMAKYKVRAYIRQFLQTQIDLLK